MELISVISCFSNKNRIASHQVQGHTEKTSLQQLLVENILDMHLIHESTKFLNSTNLNILCTGYPMFVYQTNNWFSSLQDQHNSLQFPH